MAVKPYVNFVDSKEYKADRMLEYLEDAVNDDLRKVRSLRQRAERELDSIGDVSDETFLQIQTLYRQR